MFATLLLGVVPLVFAQEVSPAPVGAKEMFPHVHVDVNVRVIELDGKVPIRLDDPRAPRVYLEQLVCTPDTKEHESLVVTQAKPSHVHAALLAIGLEPGKPATWRDEGNKVIPVAPVGDRVSIELVFTDAMGHPVSDQPSRWIVNAETKQPWPEGDPGRWVFAGSVMKKRQGQEIYAADAEGTLIGLTSFGTEVLAWSEVISPDSQVREPEWIADARHVPPMDTKVVVRISAKRD